ncbi:MAG: hypothetical protein KKD46_02125 [Euryarchaeota archaeon]|nr:hypothetical protein [Euryarchaeota archaeon]MBU4222645.1 hypothetical protein [Euryarchaeota archaeon]MBU4339708.1 hypothetical protein [Euryarchaeota archaeon]MBU4453551.1 hypothetical protein [Euryarchaeota archaeon]
MTFIETFIEIYNAGAAFIIIFLIGQILFMMRKVDKDLLKARLFLNESIMQRTWIYISVAGASFALNTLIKFIIRLRFRTTGEVLSPFYLVEFTQLIFLVAFILAVYNWYIFIGSFVRSK